MKLNPKNRIAIVSLVIGTIIFGLVFNFKGTEAQVVATPTIRNVDVAAHIVNSENRAIANGEYDVRFSLYLINREEADAYPSETDTRLWEETQKVYISNGILKTQLGLVIPIPASINFSNNIYYLGIRIGEDSEMVPRKRLAAVPLAVEALDSLNARSLNGLSVGTNAGNIIQLNAQGKVNIQNLPTGTSGNTLVLSNDARLEQTTDITVEGGYNYLTANGDTITLEQIDLTTDVTGILPLANGGTGLATIGAAGGVAFSTGSAFDFTPAGLAGQFLTSNGAGVPSWSTISLSALDFSNFADDMTLDADLTISGGAGDYSINIDSGTLFVDTANNRVGIGTTDPNFALEVTGTLGVSSTAYFANVVGIGTSTPGGVLDIYSGGDQLAIITDAGSVGNLFITGGISTYDSIVTDGYGEFSGLCLGNGINCITNWGAAGSGDITDVGSMDSGVAFGDAGADDQWLGLGATAGRIEFDDQSILDEVNILGAYLGVGTSNPTDYLDVAGGIKIGFGYAGMTTTAPANGALIEGNVGIGNTNPLALLSVGTSSPFQVYSSGLIGLGGTTPTFTLGVDTDGKFKIYSGADIAGTSEFTIDQNGVTSIASLRMGAMNFEENAGAVSWVDMPVTSSAADNTVESYTAFLDGNPMLTIYGLSDGSGGVDNLGVGIGTETPTDRLDVSGAVKIGSGYVAGATAPTNGLLVEGKVGIGTTNPDSPLQIAGTGQVLNIGNNTAATTYALFAGGSVKRTMVGYNNALDAAVLQGGVGKGLQLQVNSDTFGSGTIGLAIDSSGRVGIGTTSTSTYALNVGGSANANTLCINGTCMSDWSSTGTNYWQRNAGVGATIISPGNSGLITDSLAIGSTAAATAMFYVPGTTNNNAWFNLGSGNVGIGTTSPSSLLHIYGASQTIANIDAADGYPFLKFSDAGTERWAVLNHGDTDNLFIREDSSYDSVRLTIENNTGNVGIGTTNPRAALEVGSGVGSTAPKQLVLSDFSNGSTNRPLLVGNWSTTGYWGIGGLTTNPDYTLMIGNVSDIGADWTSSQTLNLVIGGKIGIGSTAIPTQTLTINGQGYISQGLFIGSTAPENYISTGSTGSGSTPLYIGNRQIATIGSGGIVSGTANYVAKFLAGGTAVGSSIIYASDSGVGIGTTSTTGLLHIAGTTAPFFVSTGGLVGIGTTSPATYLDVRTSIGPQITWGTPGNRVGSLGYAETTDPDFARVRAESGYALSFGSNNVDERMIINTAGIVGIGTTNPTALLSVAGGIRVGTTYAQVGTTNNVNESWFQGAVGIGKTSPSQILDVNGNINVGYSGEANANTLISSRMGVGTTGYNIWIGGGGQSVQGVGNSGSFNTALGIQALNDNTIGYSNIAIGRQTLFQNTTGFNNVAVGNNAMEHNLSGGDNVAIGPDALHQNSDGGNNTAIGIYALRANQTGDNNVAIGSYAGQFYGIGSSNNSNPGFSIYIGRGTKALAADGQNEIVIGYDAMGAGSNSVVLGSDSITKTILKGNVGIGTTDPNSKLQIVGASTAPGSYYGILRLDTNTGSNDSGIKFGGMAGVGSSGYSYIQSVVTNVSEDRNLAINPLGGNVGIGTTSPTYQLHIAGNTLGVGSSAYYIGIGTTGDTENLLTIASNIENGMTLNVANNTYNLNPIINADRARGTLVSPQNVQAGDTLFEIYNRGYYSGDYQNAGSMVMNVDGAGGSQVRGEWKFITQGSNDYGTRLIIKSGGNVGIGLTITPTDLLDVAGGVKIGASYAGMTTTAPANGLLVQGAVGIGTSATTDSLVVSGSLKIGSTYAGFVGISAPQNGLLVQGNVGINTTAALTSKLVVSGGLAIGTTSTSSVYLTKLAPDGGAIFEGNVGIGITNPAYALDVKASGTGVIARFNSNNTSGCSLATGGTITCTSDARLKKNIDVIDFGLSEVIALQPVSFNWKFQSDNDYKYLGFIAQEVEKIMPNLVTTDPNGYKELNTISMVPVLTRAIQEQQGMISQQSTVNSDQELKLTDLDLKTNQNITSVSELQTSVDEQLVIISNHLDEGSLAFAAQDERLTSLEGQLALVNDRLSVGSTAFAALDLRTTNLESLTAVLQTQIDELRSRTDQELNIAQLEKNTADLDYLRMLLGLDRVENGGDIHLLGKLEAEGIVAGALTVKVSDKDWATVGQNYIGIVEIDENNDGIDDETGDDGKSYFVRTKAVSGMSRIFLTPKMAIDGTLAVTEIREGEGFKVEVKHTVSEKLTFDWLIVGELSDGSMASQDGGSTSTPETVTAPATTAPETLPLVTTDLPVGTTEPDGTQVISGDGTTTIIFPEEATTPIDLTAL